MSNEVPGPVSGDGASAQVGGLERGFGIRDQILQNLSLLAVVSMTVSVVSVGAAVALSVTHPQTETNRPLYPFPPGACPADFVVGPPDTGSQDLIPCYARSLQASYYWVGIDGWVASGALLVALCLSMAAAVRQRPRWRVGWAVQWLLLAVGALAAGLALLDRGPLFEIMGGPNPSDAFARLSGGLLVEGGLAFLAALGFGVSAVLGRRTPK